MSCLTISSGVAMSGQINKWRKISLNLPPTNMETLSQSQVPFLYNFSSAVVPKPLDWHDNITITGYWNLENSDSEWTPPKELDDFMAKAKADKKPLVYIVSFSPLIEELIKLTWTQGFGSIVVPHPNTMTKSIIRAVEKGKHPLHQSFEKTLMPRKPTCERSSPKGGHPVVLIPQKKVRTSNSQRAVMG